jgi:GAF domain-containing protein
MRDGLLLGVVSVHRPLPGPWTPAERDLLERVRAYAAVTLRL